MKLYFPGDFFLLGYCVGVKSYTQKNMWLIVFGFVSIQAAGTVHLINRQRVIVCVVTLTFLLSVQCQTNTTLTALCFFGGETGVL